MHVYIEAAKPPTNDMVPVSSNPACGEITIKSIKMKENTAYDTVQPAVLPQYENVVMKESNEFAVALTDAAVVLFHSEDSAMKQNSAYAMTQPAAVAPQYGKFVIKENSAHGVAQPAVVSDEHKHIVMKEKVAYTTTTTTTTTTILLLLESLNMRTQRE